MHNDFALKQCSHKIYLLRQFRSEGLCLGQITSYTCNAATVSKVRIACLAGLALISRIDAFRNKRFLYISTLQESPANICVSLIFLISRN